MPWLSSLVSHRKRVLKEGMCLCQCLASGIGNGRPSCGMVQLCMNSRQLSSTGRILRSYAREPLLGYCNSSLVTSVTPPILQQTSSLLPRDGMDSTPAPNSLPADCWALHPCQPGVLWTCLAPTDLRVVREGDLRVRGLKPRIVLMDLVIKLRHRRANSMRH